MNISFRTKLILALILVSMTPLMIIGTMFYFETKATLTEEIKNKTYKELVQIDRNIDISLNNVRENCKLMANITAIKQADHTFLSGVGKTAVTKADYQTANRLDGRIYRELFGLYAETHPGTDFVYMGTEEGGYLQWPAWDIAPGYDPRKRIWYEQAVREPNEIKRSEPYATYENDAIVVSTTTAVKDIEGKIIGVVGLDVNLVTLSEMIKKIKIGESGYIFLYTQTGTMLAHPNNDFAFADIQKLFTEGISTKDGKMLVYHIPEYQKFLTESNGFYEMEINGQESLVTIYTSGATGWKMAAVISKEELLQKMRHIQVIIAFVIVMLIVAIILIIPIFTRLFTRPLEEVVLHLHSIAYGNFTTQFSEKILKRGDEIGQVGQALYYMRESRQQAERKIEQRNEELRDKQEKLEISEERYRLATEGSNDGIWDWDMQKNILQVSRRWVEYMGWAGQEIVNPSVWIASYIYPEDAKERREALKNHIEGKTGEYSCEYRLRNQSDQYLWIHSRGKALWDQTGKPIRMAGSFTDITENKRRELQMVHMAYHDSLTNLPNRAALVNQLTLKLVDRDKNGIIFLVDLDNFKLVNDTRGYEYGDKLLVWVANKLKEFADANFVARLGGDEFIILVDGVTERATVEKLAECIIDSINQPYGTSNEHFIVTASIGVARYFKDGNDPDQLMRSVDIALHQAKKLGKRRYQWFDSELEQKMVAKLQLEFRLRNALENNEFMLYYQPIIDLKNQQIVGLEALIRWQNPEFGLMLPGEFISVAEESGLIINIGEWVIKEACRFGKGLQEAGYEAIHIAVNVSVQEILLNDYVEKVTTVLTDTGFLATCLELEILETSLIEQFDIVTPKIRRLKAMGVKISLDDFGTGYSSLNYLREIPIDTVKIDRKFVNGMLTDHTYAAIIDAVIQLSHRLCLDVVAEGIEANDQQAYLIERKCDKAQGYLISKPLPENQIRDLLLQGRKVSTR